MIQLPANLSPYEKRAQRKRMPMLVFAQKCLEMEENEEYFFKKMI